MIKSIRNLAPLALALAPLVLSAPVQAEDAPKPAVTDMNSFLCKDIMRMSGDERAISIGVLHGYYLGKKGATEYVSSALAEASDNFIEHCLDHPGDKALETFGKFAK